MNDDGIVIVWYVLHLRGVPYRNQCRTMIHFIGFRGEEYHNAVKVFGVPDFFHLVHDHRAYGDIDKDNDVVVFGPKADPEYISPYSDQDHMRN